MARRSKKVVALYLRNFVFGVEDSVVSTVGLLSGIAAAGVNTSTVFLTGAVLIFVEAFSMGIGSFLSEHSAEEYDGSSLAIRKSFFASIVMFFSYFLAGFIPLSPYLLFNRDQAFVASNLFSLSALFLLGIIDAKILKVSPFRKGIEMFCIGGLGIVAGIIVGNIVNSLQSH